MDLVIHRSDCPALSANADGFEPMTVGGRIHMRALGRRCRCSAPTAEQLRELVEAATLCSAQLALVSDSNQTFLVLARLDAALEPFRKAMGRPEPPPEKG